jgi:hypothetical protein
MPLIKNPVILKENDLPGFLYTISPLFFSTQKMVGEKDLLEALNRPIILRPMKRGC